LDDSSESNIETIQTHAAFGNSVVPSAQNETFIIQQHEEVTDADLQTEVLAPDAALLAQTDYLPPVPIASVRSPSDESSDGIEEERLLSKEEEKTVQSVDATFHQSQVEVEEPIEQQQRTVIAAINPRVLEEIQSDELKTMEISDTAPASISEESEPQEATPAAQVEDQTKNKEYEDLSLSAQSEEEESIDAADPLQTGEVQSLTAEANIIFLI
jgi:hypothetical protein